MKKLLFGVLALSMAIAMSFGISVSSAHAASSFTSGSLVNDNGTIYLIRGAEKVPFTTWQSFTGLGYSLDDVVSGDASEYSTAANYVVSPNTAHPWGSWVSHDGTIYYSSPAGLVGVPTPQIFIADGGDWKLVVPANQYDLSLITPNSVLTSDDARVYSPVNPHPVKVCPDGDCHESESESPQTPAPTPTPTPTPTPVTQATTFTIPFWEVQFQIPSSISDLQYVNTDATPNILPFSTTSLANLDSQCSASSGALGTLQRSDTAITSGDVGTLVAVIDHYYYYFQGPNGMCSVNSQAIALQSTQKSELASAIASLVVVSASPVSSEDPVISNVSPLSGSVGTQITITGTGFSALKLYDPGSNPNPSTDGIFLTNGNLWSDMAAPSQATISGDTSITTVINGGACPGPTDACSSNFSSTLAPGDYSLYVVTPNGTSNKVSFTLTSNTDSSNISN